MLAPLVHMSIKNIVNIEKRFTSTIESMMKLIASSCITQDISANINKRNNLVGVLNKFSKIFTTLQKVVDILEPILETISILLEVFKSLPIPNAYTTAGLIITLSDIFEKAKILINNLKFILKQIKVILSKMISIIDKLKGLLAQLDNMIIACAQKHKVTPEQMEKLLSTPNLDIPNNNNNLNDEVYKGFKFAIKVDDKNTTQYIKRYAIAIDSYGVTILRGESSFTSEPNILIEELKFRIDSQNLKA